MDLGVSVRCGLSDHDVVKWKGSYTAYMVDTFQGGSPLIYKSSGAMTPMDEGNRTALEGAYEIAGGAGKFEGMEVTATQ